MGEDAAGGVYHVGKIVAGEVVNVVHYGAFVELEPGIVGLLHTSATPGGQDREIQDLLWIGDQVETTITGIDLQRRRIGLSITKRLGKRRDRPRRAVRAEGLRAVRHSVRDKTNSVRLPLPPGQVIGQRIRRVLVVDDNTESAAGFANWLQRLGYAVRHAETGKQSTTSGNPTYDLVFLDMDLPDTDGIDVANSILRIYP